MKNTIELEGYERLRLFKEDVSTGETVELSLYDYAVVDIKKEAALRKSRKEYLDHKEAIAARGDNFIWFNCKLSSNLFGGLSTSHVSMLFYLATYCGFEGYAKTGKHIVTKDELPELLKVSKDTARRFFNSVVSAGIIKESRGGKLYFNDDYFCKGKLSASELKAKEESGIAVKRLNVDNVRELYSQATAKSRSALAYIFLIAPFINLEHNVVCWNPRSTDLNEMTPMSLAEMCKAIGFDVTKASKLLSSLQDFKLTAMEYDPEAKCHQKKAKHVIERVTVDVNGQEVTHIVINPNVYYSGTDYGKAEVLANFK